uniref:Uncharacterized protein n=1 Tax=Arundo donax TaxID=35708 RepID=A0A0A9FBV5_ARUDO
MNLIATGSAGYSYLYKNLRCELQYDLSLQTHQTFLQQLQLAQQFVGMTRAFATAECWCRSTILGILHRRACLAGILWAPRCSHPGPSSWHRCCPPPRSSQALRAKRSAGTSH